MKKLSKISKLLLFLSVFSGILWFGNYISHYALTYKMFEPGTLDYKTTFSNEQFKMIVEMINTTTGFKLVLYPIFILTALGFVITSKIDLKANVWLLIALLLVFLTMPFEVYLLTIDLRYVFDVYYNSYDLNNVLNLIKERLLTFNTFPFIQFICYAFAVGMLVFQPFKMKKKDEN